MEIKELIEILNEIAAKHPSVDATNAELKSIIAAETVQCIRHEKKIKNCA